MMKCPKCGREMREGYLFCSKDGAFSFANEVPGVFENARSADGFVKITELTPSPEPESKRRSVRNAESSCFSIKRENSPPTGFSQRGVAA